MQRHIYRLIAMILLFAGSMVVFTGRLKLITFKGMETTQISEASFPTITIRSGDLSVNELFGYSTNMDPSTFRESLTPIDSDGYFYLLIDEHETKVKRILYEIWDQLAVNLLDSGSISALEDEDGKKAAKIRFKADLEEGSEYFVKLTAVSNTGKKIRFYTRVKYITEHRLADNMAFIMNIHNAIYEGREDEVKPYLESDPKADNSSFAYVNIKSSAENVMWGDLNPKVITKITPSIVEDNANTTSVKLDYMVSATTGSGEEYFYVSEFYRVQWTANAMYLLTYERKADAVFDPANASLAKSELKLGVTGEDKVKIVSAADYSKLCFVKERALWYYNEPENLCVKVFAFAESPADDSRYLNKNHDIRVLRMDDSGNIDFCVYGYMNRGVYEGKCAIVLYRFYAGENRIEERVYLPVESSFAFLKEDFDKLSFVSEDSVFYFSINNMLYAYNIITKKLEVIMDDITESSYIFYEGQKSVIWQSASDAASSESLVVMDLEKGERKELKAPSGYRVKLLGSTYENVIYGYARAEDITRGQDGRVLFPAEKLYIAALDGKVLKEYSKDGYFVTGAKVVDNVIELSCITRGEDGFETAPDDHILNLVTDEDLPIDISTRVTELALTEQYISLPSGFTLEKIPKTGRVVSTVITTDTTLHLTTPEGRPHRYYSYIYGDISDIYDLASGAIAEADEKMGLVVNENNRIIWERGGTGRSALIGDIKIIKSEDKSDTGADCVRMIMKRRHADVNTEKLKAISKDPEVMLTKSLTGTTVNLTGASLNEVFYYVSRDYPVIVKTGKNTYSLLIGYDEYGVSMIDALSGAKVTKSRDAASELFAANGNVYIAYIE